MTSFPCYDVIGTCRIPAHPEAADYFPVIRVKWQATSKDDYAANGFPYEGIIRLTETDRISSERGSGIWPHQDSVKRISGLRTCVDVSCGKSKVIGTESIRGVGFLCRNQATPGPFCAAIRTGKYDRADNAIPIYDSAPFLIPQSAIPSLACFNGRSERGLQLSVVGKVGTVVGILSEGNRNGAKHCANQNKKDRRSRFHNFHLSKIVTTVACTNTQQYHGCRHLSHPFQA